MCFLFLSGFVSHQAVARTAGNILIRLADSLLLPLNCTDYAESLEDYLKEAVTLYEAQLQTKGISMGEISNPTHLESFSLEFCQFSFGTSDKFDFLMLLMIERPGET